MRFLLPLILCGALSPHLSVAQQMPNLVDSAAAGSSTIYLQGTLLGGNKYILNGESYSAGASYGKLQTALMEVPEAYDLADVGSRIVTHGRIVTIIGMAVSASTFFVHGETLELGLSIGGFTISGLGGAIQMKGRNRINEAVWIYNEAQRDRESRIENR